MIEADHTKKYMVIDGHLVTLSFAKTPNPDLFDRLKSILLSSEASQICPPPDDRDTIQKKEA